MENRKTDWLLIIAYILLSMVGLLMIYSASSFRLLTIGAQPSALFQRQLIFLVLSWVLILTLQRVRVNILLGRPLAVGLIAFGVLTLLMAHVPFFGVTVNGAQRWVSIAGLQFQPSEIVNVGMILYLAHFFQEPKASLRDMRKPLGLLLICCLLILFQPKVAGVFILLFLAFIMITTVQVPVKITALLFGALVVSIALVGGLILTLGQHDLLPSMFAHVYNRIRLVGNPFSDPYGQGFQMIHSYYALFNGGLTGLGLGNSITKKGFLPVAETDFIFSVIVEEMGLFFGIFVIGLLFIIIMRLFMRSATCKNGQVGLILLGTATLLLIQTSINIASILGLMPMTGVPLPFISYGGSSYFILSFAFGLCMKLLREEGQSDAILQTA
ncbi:FtsW/RodA/SpoVE family cell cycle protein [Enterococcus sp. DIV0876]|uniref:FtsW/RodA/SpoVE family cell cycle protein n=1 Tax=Enterococcus sp. DIV0876 TaxID=2774633 RepID=UPI003D300A7D